MESGKLRFCLAEEKDIREIADLAARVRSTPGCAWDEGYPLEKNFRESLDYEGLYIVKDGERIIATCGIEPAEDVFADLDCWSQSHHKPCVGCRLCVDPDYQGRHIPQSFVQFCLKDAVARHGYDGLHFFAAKDNDRANTLYRRMGFREVGEAFWIGEEWICYEADLLPDSSGSPFHPNSSISTR